MHSQHKQFFIKYKISFYICKFLVNNLQELLILKFIRYSIDVNKYSILNIFWTFLLLFGQMPKIISYKKQITDKATHSLLVITQTVSNLTAYLYKLIHFFFLTSATDLHDVKQKTMLDNLFLIDNSYYPELSYFPRFFINSFNMQVFLAFNDEFILFSLLEKITIFRMLQLPVNIEFAQQKRKKRLIYKVSKVNKVK